MSMKEKLKALRAKEEDYTIPNTDIVIKISSLTFDELTEVTVLVDSNNNIGAMNYLLYRTFRKGLPADGEDAHTDDEIRELIATMDAKYSTEVIRAVQTLSGLGDEPKKQ